METELFAVLEIRPDGSERIVDICDNFDDAVQVAAMEQEMETDGSYYMVK